MQNFSHSVVGTRLGDFRPQTPNLPIPEKKSWGRPWAYVFDWGYAGESVAILNAANITNIVTFVECRVFRGGGTQTCYCVWGFHGNILYVAKICRLQFLRKITGMSLRILELFTLKHMGDRTVCAQYGIPNAARMFYTRRVRSQQGAFRASEPPMRLTKTLEVITNDYGSDYPDNKTIMLISSKITILVMSPSKKDARGSSCKMP